MAASELFKTLLIDADILAFKVAARAETKSAYPGCAVHYEPDEWSEVEPRIAEEMDRWVYKAGGGNPLVCLSAPSAEGWRVQVLPTYKGNRKDAHRPHHLAAVKQYLEDTYPSYRRPTLEADDIMGILSTMPGNLKGMLGPKRVIVSSDKDMKTIPGWLVNPDAPAGERMRIAPDEANWWHLYQTICGDTTDGYAGCPGMGPQKSWAALDGCFGDFSGADSWAAVVACYEARGLSEDDALVQARVARICRHTDYNFADKEVILWTPKKA